MSKEDRLRDVRGRYGAAFPDDPVQQAYWQGVGAAFSDDPVQQAYWQGVLEVLMEDAIERGRPLTMAELLEAQGRNSWRVFLAGTLSGTGADETQVKRLKQGVAEWNRWRLLGGDLSGGAVLTGANLGGANLIAANLIAANLSGANLSGANLSGANLSLAYLSGADLGGANLGGALLIGASLIAANLTAANLTAANLSGAILDGANLSGADLQYSSLVETCLRGADLTGCRIYGASVWGVKLDGTSQQQNLVITRRDEPEITVDNIEVAQFIYLMLHNEKVRDVIDTITSKAVLILGRFTDKRKAVLDALREELRKRNYLPILFDFEKPKSRDTDETITLLARMARFIVADISDAKSVLQELRGIVPDLPSVPVQPIILAMQEEPGMFDFYRNRRSFLPVHRYVSQEQLLADLGEKVIRPAELKVLDLRGST